MQVIITQGKITMDYRKMALQLFNELSIIYATDIKKHANLCTRFPQLCDEWIKVIENNIGNGYSEKHKENENAVK